MEITETGSGANRKKNSGIVLSPTEAEEYCEFKRQKRIAEAKAAMNKSEICATGRDMFPAEIRKLSDSAKRVGAAAVTVSPLYVSLLKSALEGSGVAVDCYIGGSGETTAKVKAYEAKLAVRAGAREISLKLSYSLLKNGKTGETKREIKKVCRAARKGLVKVMADSLTYAEILRVGKLAADCGAKFLSIEFFPDCGRLKRDLHDSCMLEVTKVETAADYKALIAAGVERIGTSHAEEIYGELMREAENASFAVPFTEPVTIMPTVPIAPTARETTSDSAPTEKAEAKKEPPKAEQMSVLGDKKLLGDMLLK